MNNIEFKALVKGLFLTQAQVQLIGGYKDARQIRRFFAGDVNPHSDLVAKLQEIDGAIDQAVAYSVSKAVESRVEIVTITGYPNQTLYETYSDNSFPFVEMHLCLLHRTRKALARVGVDVNVVVFDEPDYLDYIDHNKFEINQQSLASWSVKNNNI